MRGGWARRGGKAASDPMLPAQLIQLAERSVRALTRLHLPAVAKLLIADDDDGVRFSLAGVLRCEGYQVDTAADGEEALERGTAHGYALVMSFF
jgi:PleD family two-component response regulator